MDIKSATILGLCIIIAAVIVSFRSSTDTEPVIIQQTTGRFQISNPGEKGQAFVIDNLTGQVWHIPVGMSGSTDGDNFYNRKLDNPNQIVERY